jgi:PBSX family phage terminase large subunit
MLHSLVDLEARSGKTFILIYALIVRACKETSRHCIFRQHFNHVKRSIWLGTFPKVLKTCFPDLKLNLNKTDYIAHFPNGSEIHFAGLDDGDRTEKVLGLEFSTLYFNEASQVDYSSVQMAITRLAEKNGLKKKVYYDFNPPKKSHWSYHLFIKKLDPIDDVPLGNPDQYGSLLMNPQDNLMNIDSDYLTMLESMPEEQKKRFLYGEFTDESDGQAYYAFRRDNHVQDTVRIPGTLWIAEDFNCDPGTAVVFQYINNKFYIHDEIYLNNSDTYKMAHEMKKRGYGGASIIPDSTGGNRKTSGQSDFQILQENGFKIISTYNPFVTDRVNNVNRLLAADRIIINPKCKKLINDLEKVSWKDNALDQKGANKHLTHISDALGYACWKLDPFTPTLKKVGLQDR